MADEPDKPGGQEPEADGSNEEAVGAAAENERPTVSPPFDPIAFAKEILRPSPAKGMRAAKTTAKTDDEILHTHATPPQGVEQQAAAAEASRPSANPEAPAASSSGDPNTASTTTTSVGAATAAAARAAVPRRKTPTSTLSLANARIPSNLPPRPNASSPVADPFPPKEAVTKTVSSGPPKLDSLSSMNAVDREWADLEIATRPPPADGPGEDPVIEILHDRPPQLDLDEVEHDEHSADTVRRPIPEADFREVLPRDPDEPIPPSSSGGSEVVLRPREREMNDRVSLGDYSGALEIAEKLLDEDPDDPAAKACAESCRTVLRQMYATRIGPLDRVPIVMVPRDQLRWLSIDHKAGFVLSLVDGVSSLEMIIDVSGMPELDTLRILSELAQQRIISLR